MDQGKRHGSDETILGAPAAARPVSSSFAWVGSLGVFAGFALLIVAVFLWSARHHGEEALARTSAPLFTLATLLVVAVGGSSAWPLLERLVAPIRRNPRRSLLLAVGITCALLLLLARVALDAFPNSGDEYAYVLQGKTFASGRLWVDAPSLLEPFQMLRFVAKDGRWLSIYQPGWPLLLAVPERLGLPNWFVDPLLGAGLAWGFYKLARLHVAAEAAWVALLALCTCSFFLLNFASYFGHGAGALAAVLFAYSGKRYLDSGLKHWAVLAGLCLGALGFIRALNAVLLALPFVAALLLTRGRRQGLLWFALGGVPFGLLLLGYNHAVTGSPLQLVQAWVAPGREPLGAPSTQSLGETTKRLVRLYLWTSPVFFVGWPLAFATLLRRGRLSFVDWLAPLIVIGFATYGGTGGDQYGPRYYFEGWPFALVTLAKAIEPIFSSRARHTTWIAAAILAHLAFQVGYLLPRVAREHRVVMERQEVYRQVAAAGLSNAVVVITDSKIETPQTTRLMPARDLVRNGLVIGDESVTYAADRGDEFNERLRALFPGRQLYRYFQGKLQRATDPSGRLIPKPPDTF
ncbi:MAG TPA: hypothetical protein VGJ91_12770 [Polyangiaceae bacterium]